MQTVRAFFNGHEIELIEPVEVKEKTEVLVIFPNNIAKIDPEEARKLLRGMGKGERLTEKLLKLRNEDLKLE